MRPNMMQQRDKARDVLPIQRGKTPRTQSCYVKHRIRTNGRGNRAPELEICCVPSAQVVTTTVLLRGSLRSKTKIEQILICQ